MVGGLGGSALGKWYAVIGPCHDCMGLHFPGRHLPAQWLNRQALAPVHGDIAVRQGEVVCRIL